MLRVLPVMVLVTLLSPVTGAGAADLDSPYPLSRGDDRVYGRTIDRDIVVQQRVAGPPVVAIADPGRPLPPPPRVGGPYLYIPGLNGPDGPPAYPLLPFAFGYGY